MWSLAHMAVVATLMFATAIIAPVFIVTESIELGVDAAESLNECVESELKPKELQDVSNIQ